MSVAYKVYDVVTKVKVIGAVKFYDCMMPIYGVTSEQLKHEREECLINIAYCLGRGYDIVWPDGERTWDSLVEGYREEDETRGGTD